MRGYLELLRPGNCTMAAFSSIIGGIIAYLLVGGLEGVPRIFLAIFLTLFLVTGAGNAVNDFFDAKIDAVNKPGRPIPSGRIGRWGALFFSLVLFTIGIAVSYSINILAFAIAVFNSILLFFYAYKLKRKVLVGNIGISYLTGSTFLFGGAAFWIEGISTTLVLFLLASLATLAREIVKAIEDIGGDRIGGAVTIAIKIGVKPSAYLASGAGLLAVMLSPLPYFQGILGEPYLFAVFPADVLFILAIGKIILKQNAAASSRYFKYAMLLGMVAFIIGALTRVSTLPLLHRSSWTT